MRFVVLLAQLDRLVLRARLAVRALLVPQDRRVRRERRVLLVPRDLRV